MIFLNVFIGFMIANFIWALTPYSSVETAIERSAFQGVVIVYLWVLIDVWGVL